MSPTTREELERLGPQAILCPFCDGSGEDGEGDCCWFCLGIGTATAEVGPGVAYDEAEAHVSEDAR